MQKFLHQTANYIYNNYLSDFENITLIFPNHRSGIFFVEYLKNINKKNIWLPRIFTINEFIKNHNTLSLAEPIQLLGELYKTFINVTKSKESFDNFYFWGDMMLRDFDDVDKFLIDAKSVFTNVSELKNIDMGFDFLSNEQKEILKRFFNEFNPDKRTELKEKFLEIWNFLLPIYTEFNKTLQQKNLAYEGMLYRKAVTNIKQKENKDLYFFVGFNAITPCEEEIFSTLKNQNKAYFFWDYDNYYVNNKMFEAGSFIRKYLKKFPAPDNFNIYADNLIGKKNIKIISTSTNTGQIHYIGNWLNKNPQKDYTQTAVVLADELLLEPTLNYLPQSIDEVNITMGYPIKETLVGSFIDTIINLNNANEHSKNTFYYKHVLSVLRHPYLASIMPKETKQLVEKINNEFIFNVADSHLPTDNQLFKLIFKKSESFIQFTEYLSKILAFVQEKLITFTEQGMFQLDFEQLYNVNLTVNKLKTQLIEQNINVTLPIFFKLLKQVLFNLRIPFEGEPVKGLQIMGFLETRNLDFKNIIVLSANDNFLPANKSLSSFIPHSLRQAFFMPTHKQNNSIYAYYFYRLMQRAENIMFVYNSSNIGMATGEKSQFLQQLLYDNNFNITKEEQNYSIEIAIPQAVEIKKQGNVKTRLTEYLKHNKKLSPSALTKYISCPLMFYYQYVLRLREPDEITETIDARLFGNVFHNAAELIYKPYEKDNKIITKNTINKLLENKKLIDDIVSRSFTISFSGNNAKKEFDINGKNLLVKNIIKKYLAKMLTIDSKIAPFSIVGLEMNVSQKFDFTVNQKPLQIILGGKIDRLDQVGDQLRIVDYKTGNDKINFNKIEEIFDVANIDKNKAIVQTMIYSLICSSVYPQKLKITPTVYKTKEFFSPDFNCQIYSSDTNVFTDSNVVLIKNDLTKYLQNLISEIFDFDIPFRQTENNKICEYCSFNAMCGL